MWISKCWNCTEMPLWACQCKKIFRDNTPVSEGEGREDNGQEGSRVRKDERGRMRGSFRVEWKLLKLLILIDFLVPWSSKYEIQAIRPTRCCSRKWTPTLAVFTKRPHAAASVNFLRWLASCLTGRPAMRKGIGLDGKIRKVRRKRKEKLNGEDIGNGKRGKLSGKIWPCRLIFTNSGLVLMKLCSYRLHLKLVNLQIIQSYPMICVLLNSTFVMQ